MVLQVDSIHHKEIWMPKIARVGDKTQGTCFHSSHSPPLSTGGKIVGSSGSCYTEGPRNARVGDSVKADCGHFGKIVSGSSTVYDEGSKLARVGDKVASGDYKATIVSSASTSSSG